MTIPNLKKLTIIGEQISAIKNIKSIEMTVQSTKIKKGYIKKIDNINAEIILCDGGHIFTELTTCYNTWHDANRDCAPRRRAGSLTGEKPVRKGLTNHR